MLLDEQYLTWIYDQVGTVPSPSRTNHRTHWALLRELYTKEFVWFVPNDDNRAEDGRDLRIQFVQACQIESVHPEWMELGCSMLEMLVALSRRLSFEADGEPRVWFWHLIEVLNLEQYDDDHFNAFAQRTISDVLDVVIWRQYGPDGRGGLFPLQHPTDDQRRVEIWYQLSAYLIEQF